MLFRSFSDRLNIGDTAGELLEFFKDKEGRFNLAFVVSGTQSAPVLKLDVQGALQRRTDQAKKKLEEELKKKLGEGLKNLFKRPDR